MLKQVKKDWLRDKILMIVIAFFLAVFVFLPGIFLLVKIEEKYPWLSKFLEADNLLLAIIYVCGFSYYTIKEIKILKKSYLYTCLFLMISVEAFILFIYFSLKHYKIIVSPKYGSGWFYGGIIFLMFIASSIIYEHIFRIIKKIMMKKQKAKGIVDLNKFQEKAKEKIYEMLKNIGAKFEEFRKIEKDNEVYLETGIEINGKFFAIEISEEAITLAAEKEEDAFILELIDFENANKLIDEFCKRAKEIFEKAR